MPSPRYTIRDTPELTRRIESDLGHVVRVVREADPRLRSLVLTGGFARGEGGVMDGAPQNDYDFVALRRPGKPHVPYPILRQRLEKQLGIHVDLAPVPTWRLRWVSPTIFWYETALRGRVLWGDHLLSRVRIRSPRDLDPAEGLRLLVNRAAGLLLVTDQRDPHAHRLQAAKGLLAVLDAHMLARSEFAPSQRERWTRLRELRQANQAPTELLRLHDWLEWAYTFKVDPGNVQERDPDEAWGIAARAIVDAVPTALRHARLPSLKAYQRSDGIVDHVYYYKRAAQVDGARPLVLHPTGRVRIATLELLEASLDGHIEPEHARRVLMPLAHTVEEPVRMLDSLRKATLQ